MEIFFVSAGGGRVKTLFCASNRGLDKIFVEFYQNLRWIYWHIDLILLFWYDYKLCQSWFLEYCKLDLLLLPWIWDLLIPQHYDCQNLFGFVLSQTGPFLLSSGDLTQFNQQLWLFCTLQLTGLPQTKGKDMSQSITFM